MACGWGGGAWLCAGDGVQAMSETTNIPGLAPSWNPGAVAHSQNRIPHGTVSSYTNNGCRCADCREALRLYVAARRAKGLCSTCGGLARPGKYQCETCSRRTSDRRRRRLALTSTA